MLLLDANILIRAVLLDRHRPFHRWNHPAP
jgi:hypothetical protein